MFRQHYFLIYATIFTISMFFAGSLVEAAVHIVNQVDKAFSPANITIIKGDMVRWEWGDGSHTITNGSGSSDPDAGTMFDATFNSSNPVFEYIFDTPGVFPIFAGPMKLSG
jgi:plastocyanin